MNHKTYTFAASVVCLLASIQLVGAEVWKQGSIAVFAIEEGLEITAMGQSDQPLNVDLMPSYFPGLIIAETLQPSRASMLTSNGVLIDFKGPGYLGIERFEQEISGEGWLHAKHEPGQSRMIMNLRAGRLVLDQSKLLNASQAVLETPVGRFSGINNAHWMIDLSKDARKRTFSFNVYCVQGTLRFFDLMGRTFTIRSGQQISGAGAALTPSIEVAEITSDAQEYLDNYELRVSMLHEIGLTEEGFLAATKSLAKSSEAERSITVSQQASKVSSSQKRPLVIEYAPRSAPVTPYQGVARPPSAYEADLF